MYSAADRRRALGEYARLRSGRKVAIALGICRATIEKWVREGEAGLLLAIKREVARTEARDCPPPHRNTAASDKCGICGALVFQPCMACRVRARLAKGKIPLPPQVRLSARQRDAAAALHARLRSERRQWLRQNRLKAARRNRGKRWLIAEEINERLDRAAKLLWIPQGAPRVPLPRPGRRWNRLL